MTIKHLFIDSTGPEHAWNGVKDIDDLVWGSIGYLTSEGGCWNFDGPAGGSPIKETAYYTHRKNYAKQVLTNRYYKSKCAS